MDANSYHTDPTFIGMVKFWEIEGYCPFQLIDWFIDEGMDSQANAIRWVVAQPERTSYGKLPPYSLSPVIPSFIQNYYWWWSEYDTNSQFMDTVPLPVLNKIRKMYPTKFTSAVRFNTFLEAIIALVDNWEDSSDSN